MTLLVISSFFLISFVGIVVCRENSNEEKIFVCTNPFDQVCCKLKCPYCGWCGKQFNKNISAYNNQYDDYTDFLNDCCAEVIIKNKITCNATTGVGAPCIVIDQFLNDVQLFVNFFRKGPIYLVVIVSVLMFLGAAFFLYVCCIFGKKKPPIEYKYIINSLDDM